MSNPKAMEHETSAQSTQLSAEETADFEHLETNIESAFIVQAVLNVFKKRKLRYYFYRTTADGGILVSRKNPAQCEPLVHTQKR